MIVAGPTSRVRWARIGKRQGQSDDYTVLADDTGGKQPRRQEYAQIVGELVRSNPSSAAAGQPSALPWAFIAPVDTDSGRRIALVVVEWPAEEIRDATGRRAIQTRYFDVDSGDMSRLGAGYLSLFESYAAMTPGNGTELFFAVEPPDPAELASFVIEFGPRTLAGMAAMLLDGDVVVLPDPSVSDLHARLRCLDAALALLPYGIRDSIAVATWTPNDTPHRFRLMFSSRTIAGQIGIGRGQEPVLRAGTGQHYFDRIMRYIDHGGLQAVEHLVRRLWEDRREYSVHRPEQVLEALSDLNLVYTVYQDLCRGVKTVDDVVRLLRRADVNLGVEEPHIVDRLVQEVIDKADIPDLAVLSRHWTTPSVPSMAVEGTLTATDSRALALWNAARSAGGEAPFVVALVQQASRTEEEQLAFLMARHPVPGFPELGPVLLGRPTIIFRILTATFIDGRHDRLGEWAELVFNRDEAAGRLPLWAEPFEAMRSGRSELTPAQLNDSILRKTLALPALLALAAGTSGPGTFLECYTAWQALFVQLRHHDPNQARLFTDVAARIGLAPPSSQAGLDLLLVTAGRQPVREQAAMDAPTTEGYLAGLRSRFAKLTPEPVRELGLLLAQLLVPGRLTPSGVNFLLALATLVRETAELPAEEVYRWLASRAVNEPEALYEQPDPVVHHLVQIVPDLGVVLARRRLGDAAAREWPPEQVIPMCVQAFQSGMSIIAILDGLGDWKSLDNPAVAFRILEDVWTAAGRPNGEREDPVLRPGLAHLLEGRCGVARARRLSEWLTHRAEAFRRHADFLQKTVKSHKPPKRDPRRSGEPASPKNSDGSR
ncbi:hypothetical protein ACTI_66010 [Actinoplanes sp. OR16]|uniref:hypothetical protein n=1 Tax=Actinoplanes sp. OR16 TaxID=946334 RepID=UPI000F6F97BF|nr:hypothetical protein [Actinoplanes sp. OR16]BBH69916.1 hypothetical protein ACTI_66010 [Actinoplanes sp. OR16]